MRIGKAYSLKFILCTLLLGTSGCVMAGKRVDAYYLITGEELLCDLIYRNICIVNGSKINDDKLEKIIGFVDKHKHHASLDILQIKFIKNGDIHVIAASFNYDFKNKFGHGVEQIITLRFEGSELKLIDEGLRYYDP